MYSDEEMRSSQPRFQSTLMTSLKIEPSMRNPDILSTAKYLRMAIKQHGNAETVILYAIFA